MSDQTDGQQPLENAMAQVMASCATTRNFLQYDKGGVKRDTITKFAPMIRELIKLRPNLVFTPGEMKAALTRLAITQFEFDSQHEEQDWNKEMSERLYRMMRHVKQYRIRKKTTKVVRKLEVWEARDLRRWQAEG